MATMRANGRVYNIGTWICKFDPLRNGCNCCEPKDMVHPKWLSHPNTRLFAIPDERVKSKAYIARFRSPIEGSAKSRRKT